MDLNDAVIPGEAKPIITALLPEEQNPTRVAEREAFLLRDDVPYRGRVIYLFDPKTKTTIARRFGPSGHLGSVED